MKISVTTDYSKVRAYFDRLKFAHTNYPALWKPALAVYYGFVMEVFQEEGKPDKWEPLTEATIARRRQGKRAGGRRVRILQDTGQLRNSATSPAGAGYVDIQPRHMTVGSRLNYARFHHTGTRFMPQRGFFTHDDKILTRMGNVMTAASLRYAAQ